jgi:hypothetical protein
MILDLTRCTIEVPRLDTGLHLHPPYVNKLLLGSKLKFGSIQMLCVIYYGETFTW